MSGETPADNADEARYKYNPKKRSLRTKGLRSNPKAAEALRRKWQDPEFRAAHLEVLKRNKAKQKEFHLYRNGVPDGMRKAEADVLWAKAEEQAKKFIKIMEDAGELDAIVVPGSEAEMAKNVLAEAYKIAVGPGDKKVKVTAQRMILTSPRRSPKANPS